MADALDVSDGCAYSTSAKSARQEVQLLEEEGKRLRHFTVVEKGRRSDLEAQRTRQLQQFYSGSHANVFLVKRSCQEENFIELEKSLLAWLQELLLSRRKMVLGNNLFEELCDGFVLTELLDILDEDSDQLASASTVRSQLPAPTGTGTYRLQCAVDRIARTLGSASSDKLGDGSEELPWSVEGIAVGDELCTLRLLLAIIDFYKCPVALPKNVSARVVIVTSTKAGLRHEETSLELTGEREQSLLVEPAEADPTGTDLVDRLFETSPDKAKATHAALLRYAKEKVEAVTGESFGNVIDLSSGILLLQLACLVGRFFLRMCSYHRPGIGQQLTLEQKTANVRMALEFLQQDEVSMENVTISRVLEGDPATTTRLLYRIRLKDQQT